MCEAPWEPVHRSEHGATLVHPHLDRIDGWSSKFFSYLLGPLEEFEGETVSQNRYVVERGVLVSTAYIIDCQKVLTSPLGIHAQVIVVPCGNFSIELKPGDISTWGGSQGNKVIRYLQHTQWGRQSKKENRDPGPRRSRGTCRMKAKCPW